MLLYLGYYKVWVLLTGIKAEKEETNSVVVFSECSKKPF